MLTTALRLPALRLPVMEPRQWLASVVLALVLGLNIIAGASILGFGATGGSAVAKVTPGLPAAVQAVPPTPEPLRFREMAPVDAQAFNATVPLSTLPNPPALPFVLSASSENYKLRAIECLTSAIYYEAATEPLEGQKAVAQVVLNRVRHPAYPNSVCGVVFQGSERRTGCQFTFTCDGALARIPIPSLWQKARMIAEAALAGAVYKPVGWATHYHTNWVVPYWSSSLVKAANVGTHIFYRWTGGWGTRPAFRSRYAGVEAEISKMRHLSTVPSTLELKEAELTDLAAAEQAEAAVAAGSIDSFSRAVLRRYEPAKAEGVADLLATQTRPGEAIPSSLRWALTGDTTASKEAPLGRKAEGKSTEAAKPAPPKELEGVRKVGEPAAPAVAR